MSPFRYIFAISLALAAASTTARAAGGDASAASQFLVAHNAARSAVGMPPLVWNATLLADARASARARRADCNIQPPGRTAYGWNGFFSSAGAEDRRRLAGLAEEAVTSWVSGRRWFNPRTGSCLPKQSCGGYTQVVWRNAKQLGCAVASCQSGGAIVICEYYPPGNIVGERPY